MQKLKVQRVTCSLSYPSKLATVFAQDAGSISWTHLSKRSKLYQQLLSGRLLLFSEVLACLAAHKVCDALKLITAGLQLLILREELYLVPAIDNNSKKCNRCLTFDSKSICAIKCAACNDECYMCLGCFMMGRARSCLPLLVFKTLEVPISKNMLMPIARKIKLTNPQAQIVDKLNNFINTTKKQELLFFAVTGAGKTEVILTVIVPLLAKGLKILWVAPQKEVVSGLYHYLTTVLPKGLVLLLCAGSKDLWQRALLVVATVQQVLRYASYFDFLIIDEADAFPLNNNLAMWSWLKRAAIPHTKRLVVTATPLPSWLKNVFRGEMPAVFLPVRYHGQPLPLPKIFYVPRIRNKLIAGEEIQVFKEFCARVIATKGEGLIFVPRQELIPLILYALKAYATCIKATGVSASDIARSTKVAKLYKGKLNFMVTTTLLERGVTFPRCHVLVMWAEYFTHRALIQMAGRVRRKHSYQLGQVFFLTERITKDQVKVIKELTLLNKQARKAGFLK